MANILRGVLTPFNLYRMKSLNVNKILLIPIRNCGWIRDWKPGQRPNTKEEREMAAKKYYLIPEDYEPYPEGEGYGDYPKLPVIGQDARDPYEDFDWHYRRRNFGEPLHIDYEVFTSERHNPNEVLRYPPFIMISSFLLFCSSILALNALDNYFDLRVAYPFKPKQYPSPGVIHYTFEPLDN